MTEPGKMFRWLSKRKEKREQRRQDKHRQILEALKAKDTTGSSSDYGFYKDDVIFRCDSSETSTENTPHDYEEIDDIAEFPSAISRLVGNDLRFDLSPRNSVQPPQLPARTFSLTPDRIGSSPSSMENSNKMDDKCFRDRALSLPAFDNRTCVNFPRTETSDDEPDQVYNEPWDSKCNFSVKVDKYDHVKDLIQLRIYEKIEEKETTSVNTRQNTSTRSSRLSIESRIYSEIEDSDTGCDSDDVISNTGSDYSVFIDTTEQSRALDEVRNSFRTLNIATDEACDSDASSGFYEGPFDLLEESNGQKVSKSVGKSKKKMLSCSFDSSPMKFNTFPSCIRSPCPKIDEDSEHYLIPRRRHSVKETKSEKLHLPTKKRRLPLKKRFTNNRLLEEVIWRNNFKQESEML